MQVDRSLRPAGGIRPSIRHGGAKGAGSPMRAGSLLAAIGLLVMGATAAGQVSSPLTTLNAAAAGPSRKPSEDTGKTKLQAARAALAQGDFTTAEDLAREAAVEGGKYGPRDDSP